MTPRRAWTRPAERRLLEQRAAGMTWAAIAAAHGRTVSAVQSKAWELGLRREPRPPPPMTMRQRLAALERVMGARG